MQFDFANQCLNRANQGSNNKKRIMRSISDLRKDFRVGSTTLDQIFRENNISVKWEGRRKGVSEEDYKILENFIVRAKGRYSSKYWMVAYTHGDVVPYTHAASLLKIGVKTLKRIISELDISLIDAGSAKFLNRKNFERIRLHIGINVESNTGWITSPRQDKTEKVSQSDLFEVETVATAAINALKEQTKSKINESKNKKSVNKKEDKNKKTEREIELSKKVFDQDSEIRVLIEDIKDKNIEIGELREENTKLKGSVKRLEGAIANVRRQNTGHLAKIKQLEQLKYAVDTLVRISELKIDDF